eukprot:GHVT01049358.1.p1 GENE.GHVT01049358.1~~GHVT01049358.1.p1  ORF type:complete len:206 (+),score=34.71 GHVT01049358.1:852-1469(+)
MVFYFECSDPAYKIYMGKDKYENEDLIAYGFPEDIWFHACDLSSAHVYLRMPVGTELAQVPKNVMKEMAQLTKANSIEGSKMHAIDVTYTPWSNLKKTEAMKTGEVGMVDDKVVYHLKAVTRDRQMLKELERSRTSAQPDLRKALQDRNEEERQKRKAEHKEQVECLTKVSSFFSCDKTNRELHCSPSLFLHSLCIYSLLLERGK